MTSEVVHGAGDSVPEPICWPSNENTTKPPHVGCRLYVRVNAPVVSPWVGDTTSEATIGIGGGAGAGESIV